MSGTRWLTDEEMRFWRAFIGLGPLVLGKIEADLKADADLTFDDYEVLVRLSEAPGRGVRMTELGAAVLQSKSRLSQRIDRLQARGLVCRTKCPEDGRGTFAVLTEEGTAVLAAAAPKHLESVRRHLVDLLDPAEIRQATAIIEKLVDGTG